MVPTHIAVILNAPEQAADIASKLEEAFPGAQATCFRRLELALQQDIHAFDLVLVAVLPEVEKLYREVKPGTKIIGIARYSGLESLFKQVGADDYYNLDLPLVELVAMIRELPA